MTIVIIIRFVLFVSAVNPGPLIGFFIILPISVELERIENIQDRKDF